VRFTPFPYLDRYAKFRKKLFQPQEVGCVTGEIELAYISQVEVSEANVDKFTFAVPAKASVTGRIGQRK
jgi:hypothetical protein